MRSTREAASLLARLRQLAAGRGLATACSSSSSSAARWTQLSAVPEAASSKTLPRPASLQRQGSRLQSSRWTQVGERQGLQGTSGHWRRRFRQCRLLLSGPCSQPALCLSQPACLTPAPTLSTCADGHHSRGADGSSSHPTGPLCACDGQAAAPAARRQGAAVPQSSGHL